MRALLPFGLWVPVLPGTRQVTVGGAIAADVHGKNHHTEGSFGNHVRRLDLLTADGSVRTVTPEDDDPDLFWATIGGMGLTGVVVSATLAVAADRIGVLPGRHRAVHRPGRPDEPDDRAATRTTPTRWRGSTPSPRAGTSGAAVLTRGNKARLQDLTPKLRRDPLAFTAPSFGSIPEVFPNRMVNLATAKAFSAAWYRKAPKHRTDELQNITKFFHPLDIVAEWNRVYGPNGFLQYQFVVPFTEAETFRTCVAADRALGAPVVPQRAQAVRPRQPGSAVVPDAGLDADRRPADRGRPRAALQPTRRAGRRRRRSGLPGQGLPARGGDVPPDVPAAGGLPAGPPAVDPDRMFTSDLARRLQL